MEVDRMIEAEAASTSTKTSSDLISKFQEDSLTRGLTQETARRYLSSLGIFNHYLEEIGRDILDVDRDILRNFINYLRVDREVSPRTIETYFAAMASFFGFLEYERYIDKNPVLEVRKRYLRKYKDNDDGQVRKLISVEEMARLINSTMNIRDRTIISLLAKTGIRRNELIKLDVDGIDWIEQSLRLKPTAKRTNRTVFFDDETAIILHRWIRSSEETRKKFKTKALFISNKGGRLNRNGVYIAVTRPADKIGLHNPDSDRMEDHFSPHCCRHWFTTHLRRAGMPREFIQELRGDVRKEAIDIYDHIDKKELRESYLAHIPQLGI
jgi:integrase/recombinase XerD